MSEPYRPPGTGNQQGLGGAAKIVVAIVVVGVLGLVVALAFGVNALAGRWNELSSATREAFTESESREPNSSSADSADSSAGSSESMPDSEQDTTPAPGDGSGDLTAEEVFGGAVDERLEVTKDDVTAYARRTGRWDHPDCSGTGSRAVQAVLREHGCQYRVEQSVAAENSPLEIGNQVLVFPDAGSANAASAALEEDAMRFRIEGFDRKYHTTIQQANDRFVVASTLVVDTEAGGVGGTAFQNDASTLFSVLHGDLVAYFSFR